MERDCHVKNVYSAKSKMAAVSTLIFKKVLPFLCYFTNPNQIWWEIGNVASVMKNATVMSKTYIQ